LLLKRVISAAVLLPVVLALFVLGGWPYALLIVGVTLLAGLEFARMFHRLGLRVSAPLLLLLILAWESGALGESSIWPLSSATIMVLVVSLWTLFQVSRRPDLGNASTTWALLLAGGTYIGLGGARLISLRDGPDGLWWLLTTCFVVWIGDSAAYIVGRRIGRHKIAPTISPGKSWEGYAAQVLSGPLSGLLLAYLSRQFPGGGVGLTSGQGLILGIVVSVLCPAGDFLVSMMKRDVAVKDTGTLIPGHGGVLDRLDSILWAAILGEMLATLFA